MFLSDDELIELTGKKRRPSQVHALRFMGIEHKVRPDGKVIVLRSHVEKVLGGAADNNKEKHVEPNWDAIS